MILNKKYYSIYLVAAIIIAALIFMAVSTWQIFDEVSGQTSADLAIDRQVDACYEKMEKEK